MDFLLGIHHVARIRCHIGSPPPPRIKYHMVEVPIYGISPPPPPPNKNRTCCSNITYGICVGGDLPSDFFRGGGGGCCHMVLFPPGEVLLWDFFRGKVCHKVFLHGERLPYGIISRGTICHGICSLIKVCVWGGGDLP